MRTFYKDEENPYDVIKNTTTTVFRDEQTEATPNTLPEEPIIQNLDDASRRLDTSKTGTLKVGQDTNTGGINRADVSTDIVFWAGATQDNRNTAPFRVDAAGNLVASSATIDGYLVGGGSTNYGDSSDGSITFDGTSTVLGIVPVTGTYTLTRDIQCIFLTVNSGVTLITAGYVIYGTGTLTNNGTVKNDAVSGGGNAVTTVAGIAGVGGLGGTIQAGVNGVAGVAGVINAPGVNGINGIAKTGINVYGVTGGNGGSTSVLLNSGGTGGAAGVLTSENLSVTFPVHATSSGTITGSTTGVTELVLNTIKAYFTGSVGGVNFGVNSGSGSGASGASDGTGSASGAGGGSGGSGGAVAIIFSDIINNGTISANGRNGGNGADYSTPGFNPAAGGGGGGGGSGGVIFLVYFTYTNTGTLSTSGGTGGAFGLGGTFGGGIGTNGTAGSNGNTGLVFRLLNS